MHRQLGRLPAVSLTIREHPAGLVSGGTSARLDGVLPSSRDAKSLFALYEYGRLHGAVRLRWGFLDEMIPAAWVHRDEPTLDNLMERAHELRVPARCRDRECVGVGGSLGARPMGVRREGGAGVALRGWSTSKAM